MIKLIRIQIRFNYCIHKVQEEGLKKKKHFEQKNKIIKTTLCFGMFCYYNKSRTKLLNIIALNKMNVMRILVVIFFYKTENVHTLCVI